MSPHVIKPGTTFNTALLTAAEALTEPNAAGYFAARIPVRWTSAVYPHMSSMLNSYVVVHVDEVQLTINIKE